MMSSSDPFFAFFLMLLLLLLQLPDVASHGQSSLHSTYRVFKTLCSCPISVGSEEEQLLLWQSHIKILRKHIRTTR